MAKVVKKGGKSNLFDKPSEEAMDTSIIPRRKIERSEIMSTAKINDSRIKVREATNGVRYLDVRVFLNSKYASSIPKDWINSLP